MDTRNFPTFVIVVAMLCASPAAVSWANDSCPDGEFETDLVQITRSFVKPDTRKLEQTSPPRFPEEPAEIARIRSGVIWDTVSTDIIPRFRYWRAYDADRHLFIVGLVLERAADFALFGDTTRDRCEGYQFKLHTGDDQTDCMTIVAGTPDQARQFACRANGIVAEEARAVAEGRRQAEEARRRYNEEFEKIRAAEAQTNKPGAMPQVLVLAPRYREAEQPFIHGSVTNTRLLEDGAMKSFNPDFEDWLAAALGSSDPRLLLRPDR